jgi:hypothetical protein
LAQLGEGLLPAGIDLPSSLIAAAPFLLENRMFCMRFGKQSLG